VAQIKRISKCFKFVLCNTSKTLVSPFYPRCGLSQIFNQLGGISSPVGEFCPSHDRATRRNFIYQKKKFLPPQCNPQPWFRGRVKASNTPTNSAGQKMNQIAKWRPSALGVKQNKVSRPEKGQKVSLVGASVKPHRLYFWDGREAVSFLVCLTGYYPCFLFFFLFFFLCGNVVATVVLSWTLTFVNSRRK
jgi:hypothetical protein